MEERLHQLCELLGENSNILQETAKGKRHSQNDDELTNSNNTNEPSISSPLTLTSDDDEREKDESLHNNTSSTNSDKESSTARESEGEPAEGDLDETVLFEGS